MPVWVPYVALYRRALLQQSAAAAAAAVAADEAAAAAKQPVPRGSIEHEGPKSSWARSTRGPSEAAACALHRGRSRVAGINGNAVR
ncbi:hypothetical protein COCOBI_05-2670 [Coccomyxa sp. Obi]|nr:hypothetical protein COCOBI_05-2670 [Coccomyxa sp. Obi]